MEILKITSYGIPEEKDIVQLIPYDVLRNNFEQMKKELNRISDLTKENCSHCDPYRVDQNCAEYEPANTVVPYANSVHIATNHKCWDYYPNTEQNYVENHFGVGVANNKYNRKMAQLIDYHNAQLIDFLMDSLVAKHYICDRVPNVVNSMKAIFNKLVPFIGKDVLSIRYIERNDNNKRYSRYSPRVSNCAGWKAMFLIEVDETSSGYKAKEYIISELGKMHCPFSVPVGTTSEVENMKKLPEEYTVTFMFKCYMMNDCPEMRFVKYRECDEDQAMITVSASNNLVIDIPSNVSILANKGNRFKFGVSARNGMDLCSMTIDGHIFTLNTHGLAQLRSKGIHVERKLSCSSNDYSIIIEKVSSNMDIYLLASPIASSNLVASKVFAIDTSDHKPSIVFSRYDSDISGVIEFQFIGDVVDYLIDNVKVCAVPVLEYDSFPGCCENPIKVFSEFSILNIGLGNSKVCRILFHTSDLALTEDTIIFRVTFGNKSLMGSYYNSPVKYVNNEFTIQFETCINTSEIVSISEQVMMSPTQWVPVIPNIVMRNLLKISVAENYPWFSLTAKDCGSGLYLLSKNDGYVGDIPTFIPESSIYEPVVTYKSSVASDIVEVPENAKFVVFSIPINLIHNQYYNTGDIVTIGMVKVKSRVPVMFNMDCREKGYIYNKETGDEGVIYVELQRPYLNGYVDIPVFFLDNDVVEIDMDIKCLSNSQHNMTFVINVDLPEEPVIDDEDSGEVGDNADNPTGDELEDNGSEQEPIIPDDSNSGNESSDTDNPNSGVDDTEQTESSNPDNSIENSDNLETP